MGILEKLRKAFAAPQASSTDTYWIFARCRRCGEPLKARVNLRSEPSLSDDEGWIVRKGLMGGGAKRCFQNIEVVLKFDAEKRHVVDSEVTGGELISEEEFRRLAGSWLADKQAQKE